MPHDDSCASASIINHQHLNEVEISELFQPNEWHLHGAWEQFVGLHVFAMLCCIDVCIAPICTCWGTWDSINQLFASCLRTDTNVGRYRHMWNKMLDHGIPKRHIYVPFLTCECNLQMLCLMFRTHVVCWNVSMFALCYRNWIVRWKMRKKLFCIVD